MIISALLNVIYAFLSVLLVFDLPNLPDTILTLANQIKSYMVSGIDILTAFWGETCMGVVALVLELIISMNAAFMIYSLVMWVVRKIPMLNVDE